MYHIVYKTTNKLNSKYYIGVHSTSDLNDGYLGSGKNLRRAIRKYGSKAFERVILAVYSEREEALYLEKSIVTKELTEDSMCYNIVEGGGIPPSQKGMSHEKNKLRGEHRTEAQKLAAIKRRGRKTGKPAHNSKKVQLFGQDFNSISEALKYHSLSYSHYQFMLNTPHITYESPDELKASSWEARNAKISSKRKRV